MVAVEVLDQAAYGKDYCSEVEVHGASRVGHDEHMEVEVEQSMVWSDELRGGNLKQMRRNSLQNRHEIGPAQRRVSELEGVASA